MDRVAASDENTHLELIGDYVIYQFVSYIILCASLMENSQLLEHGVLRAIDKAYSHDGIARRSMWLAYSDSR